MKLTFHGGAKAVTGANYLLDNGQSKILVDCGLRQGGRYCEPVNFKPFPYGPSTILAVFITHAHIDHIGRLPLLYKKGFRGKVFSTPPTKDFAQELLLDSEKILSNEAEDCGEEPMYGVEEVQGLMSLWEATLYHKTMPISGWEAEFYNAGHILGSSSILVTEVKSGKKIIFSGDLGNPATPFITKIDKTPDADYAVMESTYGGRIHETEKIRKDELENIIEETIKAGGVLMIPSFALERTQELLFELNELVENGRIPRVPIFIDSPLAIKLTAVYKKYLNDPAYFNEEATTLLKEGDAIFDFPDLHLTLTTAESKEINNVPPPKIIIAGSGMSQGGRILHHERRYLGDPKNTLLIIGYQAGDSLGRQILNGAKEVKIMGEEIRVQAKVKAIGGYSAHADQPALLDWVAPMRANLKEVFLVQGEEDQMIPLKQKIQDELAISVKIPEAGEEVIL
ncbi:MAG: MBL fold metallo-hydrolase [Candidatus Colwellbacteria bacterium]|nr:MBL fold metallo-hydrolase [Candidatus Colwellbacteria bacterium]